MGEPFSAIGFKITDGASYQALAEEAHQSGTLSQARRPSGVLHGCCWRLGSGLEVWTVLYESKQEIVYADCRPAFRSQHIINLYPWQIVEYEEDGEALATGLMANSDMELLFELQNLTEIDPNHYRERSINASISGLAYRAQINKRPGKPTLDSLAKRYPRRKFAESDYSVRGTINSWREIKNARTSSDLILMDVDVGIMKLEVLVNRADLKGEPKRGAWLSSEVWLQGHILNDKDMQARYEGPDWEVPRGVFWRKLRREN